MSTDAIRAMHAAATWEEAKGKLRALSMIQAHTRITSAPFTAEQEERCRVRWEQLDQRIKKFIENIEYHGLHE